MRNILSSALLLITLFSFFGKASASEPELSYQLGNKRVVSTTVHDTTTYSRGVMSESIAVPQEFVLEILNFAGPGTYELSDGSVAKLGLIVNGRRYTTNSTQKGMVIVKEYDVISHKVKGEFSATVSDGIRTIIVQNGRFSIDKL